MENKPKIKRATIHMLEDNYVILKKMAIDQRTTLKKLIITALAEYVSRNGKI